VFLTEEVEPALKAMRAAAAELRRDALAGMSAAQRDTFVDLLLLVKSNLSQSESATASPARQRRK
jgi:DNA-binding MarR family transcriptional regulator